MKIGVLTTSYPVHAGDYRGRFVFEMVKLLEELGHEVDVLVPQGLQERMPDKAPAFEVPYQHFFREPLFHREGAPDRLERQALDWIQAIDFSKNLFWKSKKISKERQWHMVISHWLLPCGFIGSWLSLPHLAISHSADVHLLSKMGWVGKKSLQRITSKSHLWCVSDAKKAQLESLLGHPLLQCTVSPMPIEPGILLPTPTNERMHWVSVGRLVEIKGHRKWLSQMRNVKVTLVGEGPEKEALNAIAHLNKIELEVLDPLTHKQEAFKDADAFFLASNADGRTEGVSVAALEALAHGLPCVMPQKLIAAMGLMDQPGVIAFEDARRMEKIKTASRTEIHEAAMKFETQAFKGLLEKALYSAINTPPK